MSESDPSNAANEFAKSGDHLPKCLRDFHDAKDVFKCIGSMPRPYGRSPVSWVDGQCYVIDRFLHFMAHHGYTMQRCRKPIPFYDLEKTVAKRREQEIESLRAILGPPAEAKS